MPASPNTLATSSPTNCRSCALNVNFTAFLPGIKAVADFNNATVQTSFINAVRAGAVAAGAPNTQVVNLGAAVLNSGAVAVPVSLPFTTQQSSIAMALAATLQQTPAPAWLDPWDLAPAQARVASVVQVCAATAKRSLRG